MKRIHELTEAELLELTEEQILRHIDYECALEGVPMLPPAPGPKPSNEDVKADTTVYTIAGVMVADADHAARIFTAINSGPLFKENYPSGFYELKYLEPISTGDYHFPKIETSTRISPELWDSIKDATMTLKSRVKEWEVINKAYQDALKERSSISESVHNCIKDARTNNYRRDCLRAEFARYLDLAEGNTNIAFNFLKKAKANDLEDFPELEEEFNPMQAEVSF